MLLGQWEKALPETEESIRLEPNSAVSQGNLVWIQLALDRSDDAKRTIEQALARKLDAVYLRGSSYLAGFLRGDEDAMQRELAWAAGRSGEEDWLLSLQSDTEAYFGRLAKRESCRSGRWTQRAAPMPMKPPLCGRPVPPCARRSLAMRRPLVRTH